MDAPCPCCALCKDRHAGRRTPHAVVILRACAHSKPVASCRRRARSQNSRALNLKLCSSKLYKVGPPLCESKLGSTAGSRSQVTARQRSHRRHGRAARQRGRWRGRAAHRGVRGRFVGRCKTTLRPWRGARGSAGRRGLRRRRARGSSWMLVVRSWPRRPLFSLASAAATKVASRSHSSGSAATACHLFPLVDVVVELVLACSASRYPATRT